MHPPAFGWPAVTRVGNSAQGALHPSPTPQTCRSSVPFEPCLLSKPLSRQRLFDSAPFPWLKIEGVLLDFLDDVFLLHLAFEPTQGVFQRFPFLKSHFSQSTNTPVSRTT